MLDTSPIKDAAADLEMLVKSLGKKRFRRNVRHLGVLAAGGLGLCFTPAAPLGLFFLPLFFVNGMKAVQHHLEYRFGKRFDRFNDVVAVHDDSVAVAMEYPSLPMFYASRPLEEQPEKYLPYQIAMHEKAREKLEVRLAVGQSTLLEQLEVEQIIEKRVPPAAERGMLTNFFDLLGQIPLVAFNGGSRKTLLGEMIVDGKVEVAAYELLQAAFGYGAEFFAAAEKEYAPSFSPELQGQLQRCHHLVQETGYAARRLRDTQHNLVRSFERRYEHLVGVPYGT